MSAEDSGRTPVIGNWREAMPLLRFNNGVLEQLWRGPERQEWIPVPEVQRQANDLAHEAPVSAEGAWERPRTPDFLDSARFLVRVIEDFHRTFGAPGDYAYSTPKGQALHLLYTAAFQFSRSLADEQEAPSWV